MIAYSDFEREKIKNISQMAKDTSCLESAMSFLVSTAPYKYSYNTLWLDRPIIQYPQDIIAMQEIIWQVKPDLIIETGIAHGGSIIFSASMLALLDIAEAIETGKDTINPERSDRKVLGIDIEIRPHNRAAIEAHPMFSRIQMIEGSSIAQEIIDHVHEIARQYSRIMVFLDSMHTHDHVLAELEAYAGLVTPGSYLVVCDTVSPSTCAP